MVLWVGYCHKSMETKQSGETMYHSYNFTCWMCFLLGWVLPFFTGVCGYWRYCHIHWCVSSVYLLKYGYNLNLKNNQTSYKNEHVIFIWVNYNISLIWIKAIWGWFPLLTMIPVKPVILSLFYDRGSMYYVLWWLGLRITWWSLQLHNLPGRGWLVWLA